MIAIQRFAWRMTVATLVIGIFASAFVAGYQVGYREALREWYFLPAIDVKSSE